MLITVNINTVTAVGSNYPFYFSINCEYHENDGKVSNTTGYFSMLMSKNGGGPNCEYQIGYNSDHGGSGRCRNEVKVIIHPFPPLKEKKIITKKTKLLNSRVTSVMLIVLFLHQIR